MNIEIIIIIVVWTLVEFIGAYFREAKDVKLSMKQKLILSISFAVIATFIAVSTDLVNLMKK
jgi:hypothetical protein